MILDKASSSFEGKKWCKTSGIKMEWATTYQTRPGLNAWPHHKGTHGINYWP